MSTELNLTADQKARLIPILESEAPKVRAVRTDTSLTKMQKVERLRAIHQETDPQVKAILTPDQYRQLQDMRKREAEHFMEKRMNHQ